VTVTGQREYADELRIVDAGPGDDRGLVRAAPPPPEIPVSTRTFVTSDVVELVGAFLSGTCLAWLVFFVFMPLTGFVGFMILAYLGFLTVYALVEWQRHGGLKAKDRMIAVLVTSVGLIIFFVLVSIIVTVVVKGMKALHWRFFTQSYATAGNEDKGGALHSIVGSMEQVLLAMCLSVPLAVATAVYLNEVKGRFAGLVRTVVNAMSGVPSIVAGLFILAFWVQGGTGMGMGFSGLAGALALTIIMLPSVTRTAEEVLRLVPGGLREASLALGSPEWRSTWKVVLPTARAGVVTAIILGLARAVGETAPLILTTFGSKSMNANPLSSAQDSLPVLIWKSYSSSAVAVVARAWTAAFVLVSIVLILFVVARIIGNRQPGMGARRRRQSVPQDPNLLLAAEGIMLSTPDTSARPEPGPLSNPEG
jgi:phosphate transport system permease protein